MESTDKNNKIRDFVEETFRRIEEEVQHSFNLLKETTHKDNYFMHPIHETTENLKTLLSVQKKNELNLPPKEASFEKAYVKENGSKTSDSQSWVKINQMVMEPKMPDLSIKTESSTNNESNNTKNNSLSSFKNKFTSSQKLPGIYAAMSVDVQKVNNPKSDNLGTATCTPEVKPSRNTLNSSSWIHPKSGLLKSNILKEFRKDTECPFDNKNGESKLESKTEDKDIEKLIDEILTPCSSIKPTHGHLGLFKPKTVTNVKNWMTNKGVSERTLRKRRRENRT